ncbi:dnaJ-like protein dnj-5-like [Chlorella sorokiniana]|uniref:DnaJ-like protein dnj-5-like n=1 Tax=Chlorella sorokiniana TaxID=3076 RepID=A0A2P6TYJ7_CHLSO|nr:dnaJ-like protein dnj-5-like [Chlorella sorokiniana]|eukprot:PRW59135.1 dnaJ-like protein dnj-5-like [Chlorella sorokiniana]
MEEPGAAVEARPRFSLRTLDDGNSTQLHLEVELPGVSDSSQIRFSIEGSRQLCVHVPGRYRADISLGVPVEGRAQSVQFLKKKGLLRATLAVVPGSHGGGRGGMGAGETTPPSAAVPAAEPASPARPQQAQQQAASAAAAADLPPATSPREQHDAELYATARRQANRDAAEDCCRVAQGALRAGDLARAVRLLRKACQLDPENASYQAALHEAEQEQAAAEGSSGGSGVVAAFLVGSCAFLAAGYWAYQLAPAAAEPATSLGGHLLAGLWFLPRVLLWEPTWGVASLFAVSGGAACAALRSLDHAQRLRGRPDVVPSDMYIIALMAAWHPLLWCCCGGGWGAVLGTLGELLPIARLLGSSVWSHLLAYPAACFALRLLVGWTWPVWVVAAKPAVWLLRRTVWEPAWWLCLPLAASCYGGAESARAQQHRLLAELLFQGAVLPAVWWLSGGGWWAVGQTAVLLACDLGVIVCAERWPAVHDLISDYILGVPAPLLILRPAWGMTVGGWTWWSVLAGAVASGWLALLWMYNSSPTRQQQRQQQRQQGAGTRHGAAGAAGAGGTIRHLRNEVPKGAPEAVARILMAGNYYEVLGVAEDADEAAIRRAKRALSLATHPDKVGADTPGANEAFNLVTEACEVLGDAASRQQYDEELSHASISHGFNLSPEDMEASGIPPEWADRMAEFVEACDRGDLPQHCDVCGGLHFLRRTDRPMAAARQCDECGTRHPVRQNEVWFESASAGFMRRTMHMFCCYKGVVYDMSESAACEGTLQMVHERRIPLNRHINFFKGFGLSSSGGGGGGGGGRGGKRGKHGGQGTHSGQSGPAPPPRQQGPRGGSSKKKGRRR